MWRYGYKFATQIRGFRQTSSATTPSLCALTQRCLAASIPRKDEAAYRHVRSDLPSALGGILTGKSETANLRIFGHHVSRATLLLAGTEILVVYACLQVALVLISQAPHGRGLPHFEAIAAAATVVLSMSVVGLYERQQPILGMPALAEALRLVLGVMLGLGVVMLFNLFILQTPFRDPITLVLGGTLAAVGMLAGRHLYRRVGKLDLFKRRVIVLGSSTRASVVGSVHGEETYSEILCYVSVPGETAICVPEDQVRRLRPEETLLDVALELNAEEIVVAVRDRRGSLPIRQLLECKLKGITVTDISSFFEREQQQLQLDSLNTSWLVFGTGFAQSRLGNFVKRGFDLAFSALLLVIALPVMLATALAIRLEGPGPILYWQTRVGRANSPFEICKFRSMRPDAEKDGQARWAAGNDDRITRVGRVIRKLRIDELPQVFNVLKGEMSFVGPRPERPVFVEQLSEQIPFFMARHSIRPGITGWAQVRYPYGASVDDSRQKLQYDLYYLKNHTLFLDLVILLETVKVVLFGRGAR
jgi:sugar transferase (PEP-CTERM system associated)